MGSKTILDDLQVMANEDRHWANFFPLLPFSSLLQLSEAIQRTHKRLPHLLLIAKLEKHYPNVSFVVIQLHLENIIFFISLLPLKGSESGGGPFWPTLQISKTTNCSDKRQTVFDSSLKGLQLLKKTVRSTLRSLEVITNNMVRNNLDRSTWKFDTGMSRWIPIDASWPGEQFGTIYRS